MSAIIGYDTAQNTPGLITSFDLTAGTDPDYPVTNMLDYSTNTVGRILSPTNDFFNVDVETSQNVVTNYVGIAGHNIPIGSTVRVYDNPGGVPGAILFQADIMGVGPQLLLDANNIGVDEFRISIEIPGGAGGTVDIGSLFFGARSTLQTGLTAPMGVPKFGRKTKMTPNVLAKGAEFLGAHVQRIGWEFKITQTHNTPDFLEFGWLPMARHLEQRPFFYLWDDAQPNEAVYAWANKISPPRYTDPLYMAWSLDCSGLHVP